jgi:hypothetical protein
MLETATEPMLRARATLRRELAALEKQVRQLAQEDSVCLRLMTMPGIGAVVALTFRAAVDDPARFRSSKRICPWVGLTPTRNQSGERDVLGRHYKGRGCQSEAGTMSGCNCDDELPTLDMAANMGGQLAQRRGRKIAMVALARRIAVILHRIWVDGSVFQPDAAPQMD